MKKKENTFQLTKTTFFFATIPLRFSLECFVLTHAKEIMNEFINEAMDNLYEQLFPANQTFVEFVANFLMCCLFAPFLFILFYLSALLRALPVALVELAAGLITIVPALAITITALPVIFILAVGEFLCGLVVDSDLPEIEETPATSLS